MQVTAIICAYNEAPRIGRVLETLSTFPGFKDVIVIDDGSIDGTAEAVRRFKVRVIRNEINQGKGRAMQRGVEETDAGILFFCDADIIGLTHNVIDEALAPVLRGEKDMFIAARREKEINLGFGVTYSPLLDGQRAVSRELWEKVPARYKSAFEIESALNYIAERSTRGFGHAIYPITQVTKEEKRGYWRGSVARLVMCHQIVATKLRLYV